MLTLANLPGWALKLNEGASHFTGAGFTGFVDHWRVTNRLGELLAQGRVTPDALQRFLAEYDNREVDHQAFWSEVWKKILGREIKVPPVPKLKPKTQEALGRFGFRLIFIPKITEGDYPESFIRLDWGRHLNISKTKHCPLPGRWVAVETITKPNWDDPKGYGNGNDPLAQKLSLETRFRISHNELKKTHFPNLAKLLGLRRQAVRSPSAEECNLIGNLFLWLNQYQGENLLDFGSTNSWEWCENAYGYENRLLVGRRDDGGLAGVDCRWSGHRYVSIGFRALAVL